MREERGRLGEKEEEIKGRKEEKLEQKENESSS
jgi:hypothetical protein